MESGLRFNLCDLPTAAKRNKDFDENGSFAICKIPPHVLYACKFWTYHVSRLETLDETLMHGITSFLTDRFLYWLEVMSLKQLLSPASQALKKAYHWCWVRLKFSATDLKLIYFILF